MVATRLSTKESLLGPVLERLFGLPPGRHTAVRRDTGVRVAMPDGIRLATDVYAPDRAEPRGPVVLVRTPYDRTGPFSAAYGILLARRGLRVVVQDVRGTFGSEGVFEPFHHESADGLATLTWIRDQPWCDGRVATAGASYVGHTQWAIGPYAEPRLSAMALAITTSDFGPSFYPGGSMSLWSMLSWSALIATQEDDLDPIARHRLEGRIRAAMATVPVIDADLAAVGRRVTFLGEVASHAEPGDPFWRADAHDGDLPGLDTPVSMITGWHDLFADLQLRDFTRLQDAGADVRLTVGPWYHGQLSSVPSLFRDQVEFLAGHLLDDAAALQRPRVRLYLQGARQWLTAERWPLPTTEQTWSLGADGRVGPGEPVAGARAFRYDPADPTPTVGGPILGKQAGSRDNRAIEGRDDVLTWTSDVLDRDLDVIGEITAELAVRTEHPDADVFVRVCDVDPRGRSTNVTDRLRRLRPADPEPVDDLGTRPVSFPLWPTAYRFRAGHRIRVQVSGGALPNYVRNHQTGEPIATAVRTVAGRTQVLHGGDRPTRLLLPVFGAR